MIFIIGKILAALLFPPGIFIILAIITAILALRGWRRAAATLALIGILLLYALSTCAFSNILIRPLEEGYVSFGKAESAVSIVVLGGGYNDSSPEYGGLGALAPSAEKRAIYGLELSRRTGLPLVYSGGVGFDSKVAGSEAEAAERLWLSLGVDKSRITLEKESVDTKGNAKGVAEFAKGSTVLLVTSAFHMPRSVLAFERAGVRVIAAPTDYRAKRSPLTWADFLPDTYRLDCSRLALHEYLGILYYRLTM